MINVDRGPPEDDPIEFPTLGAVVTVTTVTVRIIAKPYEGHTCDFERNAAAGAIHAW